MLELAEQLGNVREACRQRGVSRAQSNEYKRCFQTHGLEGINVSPPTIQTLLNKHDLGSRYERLLKVFPAVGR